MDPTPARSRDRPWVPRSIDVLGVRVDDVTEHEALGIARELLRRGRGWHVVTPNAEIVMRARSDPEFRAILNRAALSIPDGSGLLLAGRLRGTPLREQVAGTDFADRLARLAAAEGWRMFLLGAAEGVAEEAARQLKTRYPGLCVVGTYAGSPNPEDEEAIRQRIHAVAPVDILLVAYGAPAQEKWIARNLPTLDVGLAVGIGGALDFLSGRVRRAPRWVRRLGFDWLFRLVLQPWRWRRQLALPRFLALALVDAIAYRLRGHRGGGPHSWPVP